MNKLVARYTDGRTVKGTTFDFSPAKDHFHITAASPEQGSNPTAVYTKDLKAVFFVKDFDGDPGHVEKREFDAPPPPGELRIGAIFKDGEIMIGTTPGYRAGGSGFFLVPADSQSNNERCYVVSTATREVRFM